MGLFSIGEKKSSTTNQFSYNEQVALQGTGQVGRVQGDNNRFDIHIADGSVESIYSMRDTAMAALDANARVSEGALDVARDSAVGAVNLAGRAFDSSDYALDVANNAIHGSNVTTQSALASLLAFQERASQTVEDAVDTAQDIALNAAPVSPGAYLQASEARITDNQKLFIVAGVVLAAIFLFQRAK